MVGILVSFWGKRPIFRGHVSFSVEVLKYFFFEVFVCVCVFFFVGEKFLDGHGYDMGIKVMAHVF